jgi:hypothetical protein
VDYSFLLKMTCLYSAFTIHLLLEFTIIRILQRLSLNRDFCYLYSLSPPIKYSGSVIISFTPGS